MPSLRLVWLLRLSAAFFCLLGIPMVASAVETDIDEFAQDYQSVVFVPKGQWVAGLAASYSQSNQKDYQFVVFEGLSGDTYNFKMAPMVGYAFADDFVAGLKFGYNRSSTNLEKMDIVFQDESLANIDNLYSIGHDYSGTAFVRNYFSIGESKRFGFFNEIQLQIGGGQAKVTNGIGKDLTGTYSTNFSLNVGLVPGLAVFLNDYSAMEVNVGVLGYGYSKTKYIKDQVYESHTRSSNANFKINLFSVMFGFSFYL